MVKLLKLDDPLALPRKELLVKKLIPLNKIPHFLIHGAFTRKGDAIRGQQDLCREVPVQFASSAVAGYTTALTSDSFNIAIFTQKGQRGSQ